MSGRPQLTVSRVVVEQVIRFAAMEVPGVVRVDRGGPSWRRLFDRPAIRVRVEDRRVSVRVAVVARPGHPLTPIGRGGVPEDVAAAVLFLASRDADYITGQVLELHGGLELIPPL